MSRAAPERGEGDFLQSDLGLRPGRDLAPVGYNDTPLAAELPVPLTSIHSPVAEAGSPGRRPADTRIAGQDVQSETLTPRLVVRECTGVPVPPPLARGRHTPP
jgi:LacI family transcriptional regulator